MNLMKLNSRIGIAGERHYASINDVMADTPYRNSWHYCDGDFRNLFAVTAILADGSEIELEEECHQGFASNHQPDIDNPADTIGVQIANMDVSALVFRRVIFNQNEDSEYSEYLVIIPPDWRKLRRRVEDALRKTSDKATLFSFAQKLNIKI